ncbi:MAG: hypothetical protein ACJAZ9_000952 [Neolewinella sp.]|jgi:hypothetical protein
MKHNLILLALFLSATLTAQESFTSNLPIIVINTNGQEIMDEPKITARMGIIDNSPGTNQLTDAFNDYDGFIGIEGRGSTSQSVYPKIGFAVETRDEDGEDLEVSILGFPQEEDWVLHGPFADKSLVRNALAYNLAGKIMDYAPRIRLVELVINGDYRGVYLFTEKMKRDNDRIDVDKMSPDSSSGDALTGGYILKLDKATAEDSDIDILFTSNFNADTEEEQSIRFLYHYPKPEKITFVQRTYIQIWMSNFENTLASDIFLDPDNGYHQYVDLQSFVDFLIINELSRNVDGYRISTYMYKEKDSKGGKLHMGPVWDFNFGFGNANYCGGDAIQGWGYDFGIYCPNDFWQLPFWWDRLREDPEFLSLLAERWRTLRQGDFANDKLVATIDSLRNEMGDGVDRNFDRWDIIGVDFWPQAFVGDTYDEDLDYLKDWVTDRADWMDGAISELTPVREAATYQELRVQPNPTSGSFQLSGTLADQVEELRIYNFTGQLLETRRSIVGGETISIDDLPAGIYLLQAKDRDGRLLSTRLVKQ